MLTELPYIYPTCDNGVWAGPSGENICDYFPQWAQDPARANYNCAAFVTKAYLGVKPRHGNTSSSITARTNGSPNGFIMYTLTFSWGDGSSPVSYEARGCTAQGPSCVFTHTYASPGSYTIIQQVTDYYGTFTNSANIRIDPAGTASTQNQSQLANALSALESALKAILQLLK